VNKSKAGAFLLGAITLVYLFLMTNQAIMLIQLDNVVAKIMGLALFGLPAVGVWAIIRELQFGLQVEKLSKLIREENTWPLFELELRPSGRPIRASAQKVFEEYAELTQKNPGDWRSWFNLSLAYDAAGDSRRARSAMRNAIRLSASSKSS
jgi:hypothetical protein